MRVGNYNIGSGFAPFVIAEMSGNHRQSFDNAIEMIERAALIGVHAVKLQTFTQDTITMDVSDSDFLIQDKSSPWYGNTLYQLYKEAHTPWQWHKPIFKRACELGIVVFSTPFDETAVDFLEDLNVPCYKIASFENNHLPLLRKVASTGKPIFLSTGLASLPELEEAVDTIKGSGATELVLMKCSSSYPAMPDEANLRTIIDMRHHFGLDIGISDHTNGIGVAVASVALGAVAIEKHFVLDRSLGGVDSEFSLEPHEFASLVEESDRAWKSLGEVHYGPTKSEVNSVQFRRSIYSSRDLKAGDILAHDDFKIIRPGYGMAPKYIEAVVGRRLSSDLPKGRPLTWDYIL